MSPILKPAEHDFDPVATFVTALVTIHDFLGLLPNRDAGAYPFAFQCFSEPISVVSSVHEQPFDGRQTTHQSAGADVVADLSCCDEQVGRTFLAVADGVQFGVHDARFRGI